VGCPLTIFWLALISAVLISVLGEALLKAAAGLSSFTEQILDRRTLFGMLLYGLAALLYMLALRRIPMSVAMPYTAVSYIAIALIGRFAFRETIGPFQIGGISLIVAGVCVLTYGSI
jgi:small multidrug resistance pump